MRLGVGWSGWGTGLGSSRAVNPGWVRGASGGEAALGGVGGDAEPASHRGSGTG